jgi:hypothetical protein
MPVLRAPDRRLNRSFFNDMVYSLVISNLMYRIKITNVVKLHCDLKYNNINDV